MTWITTIAVADAAGLLARIYARVKQPDGGVDNILMAHSLRPHSLEGHMALYKSVLHHTGNSLPKWLLEALGLYVSLLNRCAYCVEHHFQGMRRLLADDARAAAIRAALEADDPGEAFGATKGAEGARAGAALAYARALTVAPADLTEAAVSGLREAGLDDGEILEINQVVAYFAYANRTVLGLGVGIDEEALGLSPNDSADPRNWSHA